MSKAVALSAAVLAVCLSACGNEGVSPLGQRILLAETQSKCLSRGKAESEKGKTAHRQLQSEKRLYFMGLQGGVQVSAV